MSEDDDLLAIAGLQHFAFCRRQWALIHLEQQWAENARTAQGQLDHKRCHDESQVEKRGDLLIVRGMRVVSRQLGLSGICDVVEFRADPEGVCLQGREGRWQPMPVEYKHGHSKESDADRLQLCAEAMCLEEMLCCEIPAGYLFYGDTRHRFRVEFNEELRGKVRGAAEEMHRLYSQRYTPKVKRTKSCNACSLKDICLPVICGGKKASEYVAEYLKGGVE